MDLAAIARLCRVCIRCELRLVKGTKVLRQVVIKGWRRLLCSLCACAELCRCIVTCRSLI